ncbi:MAG: hypothetical protein GF331_13230 [Chitinivibrionales bacterium]|nr:hypothetical protein [Chitinivibrionales bacterium]
MSFAAADSGGVEGNYTVRVPVRLHSPASKQVRVLVNTSGSASLNHDYTVWPTDITFATGEQDTLVHLTILDDNACEPTTESIALRLEKRTPGVVLDDSVYVFGIMPSDTELCTKPWAFVHGRENLFPFEVEMGGSIEGLGHVVEYVWKPYAGDFDPHQYAGIVISVTVRENWLGSAIKDIAVPILCMSLPNAVTMALTSSSDTGHSAGNALKTHELLLSQFGQIVPITESLVNVPFARPMPGGWIAASISASQSDTGHVIGGPIVPGPVDTLAAIAWFESSNDPFENSYPARRATFPVCRPLQGIGEIFYTFEYYALFQACVQWLSNTGTVTH